MKTIEAPRGGVTGPAAAPGLPLPRFHLRFRDPLPAGTTPETVLDAVDGALRRRARAREVVRDGDRIDFVGPGAAHAGRGLLTYATGPGAVWIEREGDAFHVRYVLGFQPVYLGWSAGAAVAVLMAWVAGEPGTAVAVFLLVAFLAACAMGVTVATFDTGLREAVLRAVTSTVSLSIGSSLDVSPPPDPYG